VLTLVVAIVGSTTIAGLVRAARRAAAGDHVRRIGARTRWRLPAHPRAVLEHGLAAAALDVEPEVACELWFGGTAIVALLAAGIAPAFVVPTVLAGLVAGPIALHVARGRAQRRFVAALAPGLEHVAAALRGGASVPDALDGLAANDGPLAADLRRVRSRAELGLSQAEALATWPADRPLGVVRAVAGALAVATTVGGRAADALDGLAASLRERLGAIAEARALSSQARLSAMVVGAAPIGYLAFSALVDPSSVSVLVTSPAGRVCLAVGVVLDALAVVWMRRVVRDDVTA
jgi:tight adherence protein B